MSGRIIDNIIKFNELLTVKGEEIWKKVHLKTRKRRNTNVFVKILLIQ